MELSNLKSLLKSISCFGSLSSSNTVKTDPVQRYYQQTNEMLELLKPVLEEVVDSDIDSDEGLNKLLQVVEIAANEARELVENWHQMMSKIYFVMQIESVMMKIQTHAFETLRLINSLSPSLAVNLTLMNIESYIESIQQMDYEKIADTIKETMQNQIEKTVPRPEHLDTISKSLSLSSNRELLMEAVALDKLKIKVSRSENPTEVETINQMVALLNYIHDCHVKLKQLHSINGVPIPADFCCPLSLELMSDPVIVASGQTYEKAFIKQWLDQGLNVCPKTRQTLGHTNLIPNYTVKALIANWCEVNKIKIPDPIKSMSLTVMPVFLSSADSYANSTNISQSHSPREKFPNSPDTLIKGSISSNGIHQENHLVEKPSSSSPYPVSMGSPLHTSNGCEANIGRTKDASQTSFQLEQNPSEDQVDDEHSQSAVSNNGYLQGAKDVNSVSGVSSDLSHYNSDTSGEVTQDAPATSAPPREPEFTPNLSETWSRNPSIWRRPSERFIPRIISSPTMESRADLSGIKTQVRKLIEDLKSDSIDEQRDSTEQLRLLARHNMDNRIVIANCGAINLLIGLLHSTDQKIQENAVTALLNLSINDNNKTAIANADAIDPLIHVLETGTPEAKENSAATLFSLSVIEENKVRIGRSRAIKPLVDLLGNGSPRGKKDAATALFNLSIFHENKARIVQAGAVRYLVELMDPAAGMVDKAVAVLANLATIPEGRTAIGREGGIPVLVVVVELGSARGKENAAAALLQLCTNSSRFCSQVLQEGAVPPLVALTQSGTARAKEKAQSLLSHFRNQRHGSAGRP